MLEDLCRWEDVCAIKVTPTWEEEGQGCLLGELRHLAADVAYGMIAGITHASLVVNRHPARMHQGLKMLMGQLSSKSVGWLLAGAGCQDAGCWDRLGPHFICIAFE